jgi:hypothetical protein
MNSKTNEGPETIDIVCPNCQRNLTVSVDCMSLACRYCNQYVNVKEVLNPVSEEVREYPVGVKILQCLKCGKEICIDKNAQAVTCRYCYHGNDLSDHKVKTALGKKLETHGTLYLKRKGSIEISDIRVGNAVIKGRIKGNLNAFGTVEILKRGEVYGKITCSKLIVKKGGIFSGVVDMLDEKPSDY